MCEVVKVDDVLDILEDFESLYHFSSNLNHSAVKDGRIRITNHPEDTTINNVIFTDHRQLSVVMDLAEEMFDSKVFTFSFGTNAEGQAMFIPFSETTVFCGDENEAHLVLFGKGVVVSEGFSSKEEGVIIEPAAKS
jgi:hypothetical protein